MNHANLIGGQWVDAESTRPNINPSNTNDVIGHYASADASAVDAAVVAAKAALPAWANASPQVRFDLLDAVGNKI